MSIKNSINEVIQIKAEGDCKSNFPQKLSAEATLEANSNRCSKGSTSDELSSTKVYYHIDDEPTPYCTEVQVRPSKITLADFKRVLNRSNFKFYYKAIDRDVGGEVKAEIRDDFQVIPKSHNGQFELFLLTAEGSTISDVTDPMKKVHMQRNMPASLNIPIPTRRPQPRNNIDANAINKRKIFGDSTMYTTESDIRMFSDDDSRYTTSEITSVSQQVPGANYRLIPLAESSNKRYDHRNKLYWTREKRRRPKRNYSVLSSTFDDTEISMALDIITVTFNMDNKLPFGMSVLSKQTRNYSGIFVHTITPNSIVALDGRIKSGYILLEVDDVALDCYNDPKEAIELLKLAVHQSIETRGQLKLSCSRGEQESVGMDFLRLPPEPVRPIDPAAWVAHANAAIGLDIHQTTQPNRMKDNLDPAEINRMVSQNAAMHQSQKFNSGKAFSGQNHLTLIPNPCTEMTSTSGLSSLTISSGQPPPKKINYGKENTRQNHGIFSAVLRRLSCFPSIKHDRKKT